MPWRSIACIAAFGFAVTAAAAHEMTPWYRSLNTPEGMSCCSEQDCRPVEARIAANAWEVLWRGVWTKVPPHLVLRVANPSGEPTLCATAMHIRCFVPVSGT